MPRRKKNTTRCTAFSSANSTLTDNESQMAARQRNLEMIRAEVKEKMKRAYQQLCDMEKEKLALFDLLYKNCIMALPKSVLNAPCDLDNEDFREMFFEPKEKSPSSPAKSPAATKRRSRSVVCRNRKQTSVHPRSSSVDVYKTPAGKMRLSSIMSQKKYTVTKPRINQDSGVHLKRIMKPNEEAISTAGSPLHVLPCSGGLPQASIPLPGGVVLNVEAKKTRQRPNIPPLDEKTKNQIKLLCDQLNSLFY